MNTRYKWLFLILLFATPAFAQNVRYDNVAFSSVQGFPFLPSATITICTAVGAGQPCSPTVAGLCATQTDTVCNQPATFTSDTLGNFGFWIQPGTYTYTVTKAGFGGFGPKPLTFPCQLASTCTSTGQQSIGGSHTFVPAGSTLSSVISAATAGQTIDIACGTYSISSTLSITGPLVIRGQAPGANFVINNIQFGSYTPCVKIVWTGTTGSPMMDITNVMGVIIDSIVLDGSGAASRGLHLKGLNKSTFTNMTFNNFIAGNTNDAAMEWEGGDTGKTNVQWNVFSNITFNGVVKGWHLYSANPATDSATNQVYGMHCTLVSGAGDYCLLIDSADNNDWYDIYAAFVSGSTGSCVTLNDASGNNKGAQANYFYHLQCNSNMTVVANVAPATGTNYVYGYDKSNGMPDVSGLHPGNLVEVVSSDSTQMFKLPNQARITWENGAETARVSVMRLDASNNVIAHQGTGGCWQSWDSAEGSVVAQFCDSSISLNKNAQYFGTNQFVTSSMWTETTAQSGFAGQDLAYADSTAHATALNYNNSGITNFIPKTIALTADWTCGTGGTVASCTSATIIGSGGGVPLTFPLPLVANSLTLTCDGVVGQATAATLNQWNLLTATNGATNVTATYSMATAATASAYGAVTDQASTTTTFQISPSWTLGGTATKMPFHIWAKIEGASASGTVISLQLLAPTVGDLVTIYRGTACTIF